MNCKAIPIMSHKNDGNAYPTLKLTKSNQAKSKIKFGFILFLVLPFIALAQGTGYKIYDVAKQNEISLAKLIKSMRKADVIFFGEEHNDSVAHALELEIYRGLHRQQKQLSLSLEMFQTDVQLILDEYLAGLIRETNLEKDGKVWSNYKDYKPLIEYSKANSLYVLAANAPSRYTNRVTRNGLESLPQLSSAALALLAPLPIDTLTGRYYEKFVGFMGGHEHMAGMKIYQSQNLWDATMAYKISRLAQSRRKGQILHLNGRVHSDEKLGTVAHLQRYMPQLKIVNISAFSHEQYDQPNWSEWANLGDFIIITDPKASRSF